MFYYQTTCLLKAVLRLPSWWFTVVGSRLPSGSDSLTVLSFYRCRQSLTFGEYFANRPEFLPLSVVIYLRGVLRLPS